MDLSPEFLEDGYRRLALAVQRLQEAYPELSGSAEAETAFFRQLLRLAVSLTHSHQGFIIRAHHQPLLQSPSEWEIISSNQALPPMEALMEIQSYFAQNHLNATVPTVNIPLQSATRLMRPLAMGVDTQILYLEGQFTEIEAFHQEMLAPFWSSCAQLTRSLQERKHLLAQLQDMTIRKEESEMQATAKSEFLATISHEIRTPMSAVLGMASLLAETPLSDEQRSLVDTICGGSSALLEIINDFLDFSKMEFGKMELDNQPFELKASIEEIFSLFYQKAIKKGLRFSFHISRDIPRIILGDSTRLRQILVNLIENALKFTEYGEITLTVQLAPPPQYPAEGPLSGSTGSKAVYLEFCVRDTGCGIPQDQLQIIFDSFTQGAPTVSRKYGGTGLGLTICNRLSHMMGGQIRVESEVGQGSAFYFSMETQAVPWKPVEIPEIDPGLSRPFAEQYPMRILVAEDNAPNRKFISHVLSQLGYQATFAQTGPEILAFLENQAFDLIFMDVQMPEMDGIEVTQHILNRYPEERRPKIIAMTAFGLCDHRRQCLAAGMDDYVSKPVSPEQIRMILSRWHEGKGDQAMVSILDGKPERTESVNIPDLLTRAGNNPVALRELTRLFGEDGRALLQKIKQAYQHNDLSTLQRLTHELKGVCATFSVPALQSIAAHMESILRHGTRDGLDILLDMLETEFQAVEDIFRQLPATADN